MASRGGPARAPPRPRAALSRPAWGRSSWRARAATTVNAYVGGIAAARAVTVLPLIQATVPSAALAYTYTAAVRVGLNRLAHIAPAAARVAARAAASRAGAAALRRPRGRRALGRQGLLAGIALVRSDPSRRPRVPRSAHRRPRQPPQQAAPPPPASPLRAIRAAVSATSPLHPLGGVAGTSDVGTSGHNVQKSSNLLGQALPSPTRPRDAATTTDGLAVGHWSEEGADAFLSVMAGDVGEAPKDKRRVAAGAVRYPSGSMLLDPDIARCCPLSSGPLTRASRPDATELRSGGRRPTLSSPADERARSLVPHGA